MAMSPTEAEGVIACGQVGEVDVLGVVSGAEACIDQRIQKVAAGVEQFKIKIGQRRSRIKKDAGVVVDHIVIPHQCRRQFGGGLAWGDGEVVVEVVGAVKVAVIPALIADVAYRFSGGSGKLAAFKNVVAVVNVDFAESIALVEGLRGGVAPVGDAVGNAVGDTGKSFGGSGKQIGLNDFVLNGVGSGRSLSQQCRGAGHNGRGATG